MKNDEEIIEHDCQRKRKKTGKCKKKKTKKNRNGKKRKKKIYLMSHQIFHDFLSHEKQINEF